MAWAFSQNSMMEIHHQHQQQPFLEKRSITRRTRNKMVKKQELDLDPARVNESIDLEKQLSGTPDAETYAILLRRCGRAKALIQGKRIHSHIFKSGFQKQTRISNLLVQMYGECGSLEDAKQVFESIPDPNIFSWNIMLSAYAQNGQSKLALELFGKMADRGIDADKVTYVILLRACSNLGALREGRIVHAGVISSGLEGNVVVATAIVNMYGKCGSIGDARSVFDRVAKRDVVCWNAMISAYGLNGLGKEALQLYWKMQYSSPLNPDAGTFVAALEACGSLEDGKKIHARIVSRRLEMNVIVATALVSMYSKCGCLRESVALFNRMEVRNVVSWTAMLAALVQSGEYKQALELFQRMKVEGVKLDAIVFTIVLDVCSKLGAFEAGRDVHMQIVAARRRDLEMTPGLAAAVVNMYACCDKLSVARSVVVSQKNVLLWNALIAALTREGQGREALRIYGEMPASGVRLDRNTLVAVLESCACTGALAEGRLIHTQVIAKAYDSDPVVVAALVSMYSRCGSLVDSVTTFNEISRKNSVVLWTTMIGAYGQHRQSQRAFDLFSEMSQRGLNPNKLTFAGVFAACGMVGEAVWYFRLMMDDYDTRPLLDHYNCVIHLLGVKGKLREAQELIDGMPFEPSSDSWMSLLNACELQNNVELGRKAAENVFQLEPRNALAYLTLGKIYAHAGMWDEIIKLKQLMQDRGLKRETNDHDDAAAAAAGAGRSLQTADDETTLRTPAYIMLGSQLTIGAG